MFIGLFGFFCPTREFFTYHIETSQILKNKIKPMLGIYNQWAVSFLNVPHLLWHGPTLYNGHLRGIFTHTPFAERLAVELSLPVLTTYVCPDRESNPDLPYASKRSTNAAVILLKKVLYVNDTYLRSTSFGGLLSGFSICCCTQIDNNNIYIIYI